MAFAKTIAAEIQKIPTWAKDATLVLGASFLLALCAHFSIRLPFTPVPIVLQASLVLLLGVVLGKKRAVASVALFLGQAAMGLPVLANGAGGLARFVGPSGGYLIGYLIAAYFVGAIIERFQKKTLSSAFVAMIVGNAVLYLCGAAWLSTFVGFERSILLGIAPFVIGDLLKIAAGLKILQWMGWASRSPE